MKTRFLLIAVVIFTASIVRAADTPSAPATSTTPVRVAVANAGRILVEMQETKELDAKIKAELANVKSIQNEKQQQLKDLEAQRNALRPESPQYQDRNRELIQKAIEFKVWADMTQSDMQRHQKQQMKLLFEKIQAGIAEVAAEKSFDVVIADQRTDFPSNLDDINVDQLRGLINQRIVLYAGAKVDITADVIARLDLKYSKGLK
jgi:Skp family chaperone for outer membrane proteins